jgi:predicted homoserine dehydrogenase-like protein
VIIVDRALECRANANDPIRIAILGAGFAARGLTFHILKSVVGVRVVGIANRTVEAARRCYTEAGVPAEAIVQVDSLRQFEEAVAGGKYAVTADPALVCRSLAVDVLIEATGTVEYAARAVLDAMENGKHVIVNAEIDGTVGPILKAKADRLGVLYSGCDGDQPAVQVNLVRYVKGIGMRPLLCGNVKGLQDHYRTPDTQKSFADMWGLSPVMATNFADGTKISFEQAVTANAVGMSVAQRGMLGYEHRAHVDELITRYDVKQLEELGGVVDYVVGASPGPGIFVLAAATHSGQCDYLRLYKMGDGPLYCFYTPFHLCFFDVPFTVARVVLYRDAALSPLAGPRVEVVAAAKRDLDAGEVLDGIGGFTTFGQAENAREAADESLLPIGVTEGCRLTRAVAKDATLTYGDVYLPPGRLVDQLRDEQERMFGQQRSTYRTPTAAERSVRERDTSMQARFWAWGSR